MWPPMLALLPVQGIVAPRIGHNAGLGVAVERDTSSGAVNLFTGGGSYSSVRRVATLRRVATDTCGQLNPLKLRSTV
jgi:hypothetical protein